MTTRKPSRRRGLPDPLETLSWYKTRPLLAPIGDREIRTGGSMSGLLIFSTTAITLALVFYSLGVWSERIARYLKPWHVGAFWTGFALDVCGTAAMHFLATRPFDLRDPHTLTGQIALWLMLAHAAWATRVARRGSDEARRGFHRYSLFVWLVWLVPYFGGMYLAMRKH